MVLPVRNFFLLGLLRSTGECFAGATFGGVEAEASVARAGGGASTNGERRGPENSMEPAGHRHHEDEHQQHDASGAATQDNGAPAAAPCSHGHECACPADSSATARSSRAHTGAVPALTAATLNAAGLGTTAGTPAARAGAGRSPRSSSSSSSNSSSDSYNNDPFHAGAKFICTSPNPYLRNRPVRKCTPGLFCCCTVVGSAAVYAAYEVFSNLPTDPDVGATGCGRERNGIAPEPKLRMPGRAMGMAQNTSGTMTSGAEPFLQRVSEVGLSQGATPTRRRRASSRPGRPSSTAASRPGRPGRPKVKEPRGQQDNIDIV
ncbi:unnamed protein product [Amoebophrya sp. A120]|nr:unnamed protein product [Amoebophrya sp. A120]|eukprot:GSA120T00018506001.1